MRAAAARCRWLPPHASVAHRALTARSPCAASAQFVLLDEPTTGMDPMNRREVWHLIDASKADRTIMLTTHSMEEADALGDRVGIMSSGLLVALGTPLHLKTKFGVGYQLRLVTPPPGRDGLKAQISALAPAAVREGDAAGHLSYPLSAYAASNHTASG